MKQRTGTLPNLIFLLLIALTAPALHAGAACGLVLATAGHVQIQRDNITLEASRKTELHVDDEIHTGDNARAQLRLADGTVTTLGANTGFRIQQYAWHENNEPADVKLELVKGAFRSVTGKALDIAGSQFTVQTPVGVIGIRGTDFWGGYLDGNAVDVLLIDGKHAVEITNASGTVRLEKPGQGTTMKADQSALAVKEWPQAKVERAIATIAWPDGVTNTEN